MRPELFKIRAATSSDVPVLLQMIKELADFEKIETTVTENNLREALFHDLKGPEALMAEENSIPIGYCIFYQTFSCSLGKSGIYIEDVYIKELYRKKGYGTAFFKEVAQIAKARRCGRLYWSVRRIRNRPNRHHQGQSSVFGLGGTRNCP